MKVNGRTTCEMEKENTRGPMAIFTKENLSPIHEMATEFTLGPAPIDTKAISKIMQSIELVASTLPMETNLRVNILKEKRNGKGTYTWPHGDVFTGEYKDDARNGYGVYKYAYKGTYSGNYVKDKRHGKGTYAWPDGDRYVGQWESESRRGPGTLICADGKVFSLLWNETDNANYAYVVPDKFPNSSNSR